jgi:hypothetical protein
MTSARGCLRILTATIMRLARKGDLEGLRTYVRSDKFMVAFTGLDPGRRQTVMRCYGKAEAVCEARAARPLVQPRPIDAKRAHKTDWSDPGARDWQMPTHALEAMTSRLHGS